MKVSICYVCPVIKWNDYEPITRRFLASYRAFPPGYTHDFHLIFNGGNPTSDTLNLFLDMNPIYHYHDNSGWDIGAFSKVADVDCDAMLFLGANTYFKRDGWLRRMVECREKFGPGLFGTSASFEICPHIRTNGFMCHPKLVSTAWAKNSSDKKSRHHFELGKTSLTAIAMEQKLPIVLVAWDGFYMKDEWRKAPNIFRRGDQSNCLIFDRHHEVYESKEYSGKIQLEKVADGNKFERFRHAFQTRFECFLKSKK